MAAAGDTIAWQFVTKNASKALVDADSTPTGTLVKNGTDTALSVAITKSTTGTYNAQFTIPDTYVEGDEVALRINATIGGVATGAIVWQESLTSGATAAAVESSYATNLETIRDQIAARLVEITAEPKPSYNVNGQQVAWNEYFTALTEQLAKINELIAQGDGAPWEEQIQVFL